MALRDRLQERAAPHLQPGETVQETFIGQTVSPWWSIVTYWIIIFGNAYRVIVVTDRRILVFRGGRLAATKVKELLRELPRATVIGPAHGLWYKSSTLGEQLYVHKRFHKDIAAADAEAIPPPPGAVA